MRMPRPLHPLACRIGRVERAAVVAFARERGISVSGLIKNAVRTYIAAAPAVEPQPAIVAVTLHRATPTQPPVNAGVNRLTDLLSSPPLVRPYRLSRAPQRGARVVGSGAPRGGLLSDC
jgi:hypothetical protein